MRHQMRRAICNGKSQNLLVKLNSRDDSSALKLVLIYTPFALICLALFIFHVREKIPAFALSPTFRNPSYFEQARLLHRIRRYERSPWSRSRLGNDARRLIVSAEVRPPKAARSKLLDTVTLVLPISKCEEAHPLIKTITRQFGASIKYQIVLLKNSTSSSSSAASSASTKCKLTSISATDNSAATWQTSVFSKITTQFVFLVNSRVQWMTSATEKSSRIQELPDIAAYLEMMTGRRRLLRGHQQNMDVIGFDVTPSDSRVFEPFSRTCHQLTVEKYELDVRANTYHMQLHQTRDDGEREQRRLCAACDYVAAPMLLIRTRHLKSLLTASAVTLHVALLHKFIALHIERGGAAAAAAATAADRPLHFVCSDDKAPAAMVMADALTTGQPASFTRKQLMPIARAFDFSRITVQSPSSETTTRLRVHEFAYEELDVGCKIKKGYVLSNNCYDELVRSLYDINAYTRGLGISLTPNCGNTFGTIKFFGVLPWERDSDVDVPFSELARFKRSLARLRRMNAAYSFNDESYCSKHKNGTYRQCGRHYFDYKMKHWRVQVYAERVTFQRTRGNLSAATRTRIGHDWFYSPTNPNLYLRNYYSGNIYQHVEHYSEFKGMSTHNYKTLAMGNFASCGDKRPGYHGCLYNYFVEGNIQFIGIAV